MFENAVQAHKHYEEACKIIENKMINRLGFGKIFYGLSFEYVYGDGYCITWGSSEYGDCVTPIHSQEELDEIIKIRSPRKMADWLYKRSV